MSNLASNLNILTNRFNLRQLNLSDVTQRYADWLNDPSTNHYISTRLSLKELQNYVIERTNRDDVLFLGIFNKVDGVHIGNIKYEPVNTRQNYAVMGILIGDSAWRGKGVAGEVILASVDWLHKNKRINHIILGVNKDNSAAIRAYQKIGFIKKPSRYLSNLDNENTTMVLDLNLI